MYLLNEDCYEVIVHSAMDSIFYAGYDFHVAMERYTKALTGFPYGDVEFYKNGDQIIKTKIFFKNLINKQEKIVYNKDTEREVDSYGK